MKDDTQYHTIDFHNDASSSIWRDSYRLDMIRKKIPSSIVWSVADLANFPLKEANTNFIDHLITSNGNWANQINVPLIECTLDHVRMPFEYVKNIIVAFINGGFIKAISRGVITNKTVIYLYYLKDLHDYYQQIPGFIKVNKVIDNEIISEYPLVLANEVMLWNITNSCEHDHIRTNHIGSTFYIEHKGDCKYVKLVKKPSYQPINTGRERDRMLEEQEDLENDEIEVFVKY